jgi:hypothetical protein
MASIGLVVFGTVALFAGFGGSATFGIGSGVAGLLGTKAMDGIMNGANEKN